MPLKPDARWHGSVLDIGAGNGKVLDTFAKRGGGPLYAIEKSPILQQALPPEVFIVGADFAEQTLHSKPVEAASLWNTHYRLPAPGNPNLLLAA